MHKTLNSYDQCADKYNDKFSVYEPYQKQINKFVSFLKDTSKILDVGCGTGLNSKKMSEAGHKITGFDFSESMIEIARTNCPTCTFLVSTTQDFTTSEMFDGICLSFIIVHLSDQEANNLIEKVSQLLNPGGYIYISFMTGKQPGYETTSFSDSEIYFNYYNTEDIIDNFKKNHFSVESFETEPYAEKNGSITEDIFLIFRKEIWK